MSKQKPASTPRALDERLEENHQRVKKAIQDSKSAVLQSQHLIKESRKVLAAIKERHAG